MTLLKLIAAAFFRELFSALASYVTARREIAQSVDLGRAEAQRDAAIEVAQRASEMNGVTLPDDDDLMRRLREGSA